MSLTADSRKHRTVPFDVAERLLESVVSIGAHYPELADRRRAFLTVLKDEIKADSLVWAWGYGKPTDLTLTVVAYIVDGMTDAQQSLFVQLGFNADVFRDFYSRIYQEMKADPRSRTLLESDYNKDEQKHLPAVHECLAKAGWSSWIQNVRYLPENAFSNISMFRNAGQPQFNSEEAAILEVVGTSVAWLHANVDESLPRESLMKLTQRQRTVLLMLLDGSSRKVIARQLGISEDTVGDHLKVVYDHFNVSSGIELAALFLRNR